MPKGKNQKFKLYRLAQIMLENTDEELVTVEELCAMLMIGKNLAYKLLSSGQIKCFRINRIWKIPKISNFK